ncbi:MAG: Gfo/Idh/MocA family protein, partial [Eubacteriales bacterium]
MQKLNVAIIGQGRSGRDIHGRYFLSEEGVQRYHVAAVADTIEARRNRAAQEYGCDVYEDYREILKRSDIDVVVNSTFSYLHYPVTMDALRHGKNVVSEKPFSKFAIECEDMIRTAQENDVTLTVFQQSRVAPYFLRIREILDSGKLGDIAQITIHFSGYSRRWDWQTSRRYYGGCLLNTGPHPLDQALQLLNTDDMPNVFSVLKRINSAGDAEDYAKVILTAPNRPLIDLEISPADAYNDFTYRIHGSRGSLTATLSKIKWKYFDEKPMPAFTFEPLCGADGLSPAYCSEKLNWNEFEEDMNGSPFNYAPAKFYENLYNHLVSGEELLIKPEKIVQQIRVIELI